MFTADLLNNVAESKWMDEPVEGATVKIINHAESDNGDGESRAEILFEVLEPVKYRGRRFKGFYPERDNMIWKMAALCRAAGCADSDGRFSDGFKLGELHARSIMCDITKPADSKYCRIEKERPLKSSDDIDIAPVNHEDAATAFPG